MTPLDTPKSSRREFYLLLWASMATVAAVMLAALALYFYLHPRTVLSTQAQAPSQRPPTSPRPAEPASSSFADVRESDIPGRYRFFENGVELGTMLLKPDHTFINKDGGTFKRYRWDVSTDGLEITWQRGQGHFTILEKPGVYIAPPGNNSGKEQRLEKLD